MKTVAHSTAAEQVFNSLEDTVPPEIFEGLRKSLAKNQEQASCPLGRGAEKSFFQK